jgi:cytochrome P450
MPTVPVVPGRWPLLGHTPSLLWQRLRFTAGLAERGRVVKVYIGHLPVYAVTAADLAQQVMIELGGKFEKGAMFDKFRPYFGNGLVMSNGAVHLRQRRLVQPAFHRERISGYAEVMRGVAEDAIGRWRPGEVRAIDDDMQAVATAVVAGTLFSSGLSPERADQLRRWIPVVIKQGLVRAMVPEALQRLPIPANRRFDEAVRSLRSLVQDLVATRRADGTDHGDLLSMLVMARDEDTGAGMTDEQVYDEVVNLLTAGIETTALAMAWFFHELGANPAVEERVIAEIDEVLSDRPATLHRIQELTYTGQVVDEVLRRYPVWLLMRRTTEEVELDGVRLPAGTEVAFSPHAIHHDPRYHPDPHRFDPDRFSPERAAAMPREAYLPFASGTRRCVGAAFARTEVLVVTATVLRRYRLAPVPGKPVGQRVTGAPYPTRLPMTVVPR